jgi:hypothetical protein
MRLLSLLAVCIMSMQVQAHSLPDPDRVITLELPLRDVEQLAAQVEAILVGNGFHKGPAMPRMTLDMTKLPTSASADQGIIVARFDKEATISLFMHATTCRVSFTMTLPDRTDKKAGEQELQSTQELLVSGLSGRGHMTVTLFDGLGSREDPCIVPVRSNTSPERTRER